ncbi:MAG: formimidoylglutamate deiminase [Inhella sp.]|jgi:formimidoylglutamate deiminase|uniref:formimidoylglutamate deiminase n=1 Tax=Inhella sp. TaxID=1921806 RepID=UPI0022C09AA8|nr:formimidoylglutamate deiminase [Inhella sp.]MCZ8236480.1 formimidoylglutamate deiminase [Inhella sp.]
MSAADPLTDTALWAPWAWVDGRWRQQVLLPIQPDGRWGAIASGVVQPPEGTRVLHGALVPSLVNAHSHAFQRAMAGLTEVREHAGEDDFWSWREAMYGTALALSPDSLRRVATQLYGELLRGGYTQVVEFHYLHHAPDGQPYEDELAMAWALADAAEAVGIGLTVLPTLYAHQGFDQPGLRPEQRRFAAGADWVWRAQQRLQASGRPLLRAGVALHSLRAAHPEDLRAVLSLADHAECPIHIHVAEQLREVDDCLRTHGQRPLEWLCAHGMLDARWQLVHATHALPHEIDAVAACCAGVVLCPSTEANLGDGFTDVPGWLDAGVPLSVGSDSQVSREWREELRWLEYGQRLRHRRRNVCAAPGVQPSTGARLLEAMRAGSGPAAGYATWGLRSGARADALMVDLATADLDSVPMAHWWDALVFASAGPLWSAVWVAGRQRL